MTARTFILGLLSIISTDAALAVTTYHVTEIATSIDATVFRASDINNSGHVLYQSGVNYYADKAFIYRAGVATDIGSLGAGGVSAAALNDSDQVTGQATFWSRNTGTLNVAFLYTSGRMIRVDTADNIFSYGRGLSNSGIVVGGSVSLRDGSPPPAGFSYSGGNYSELRRQGYGVQGMEISSSGEFIAGTSAIWRAGGAPSVAFLLAGNNFVDIGTLPGTSDSRVTSINSHAQIVGTSSLGSYSVVKAFIYSANAMSEIGTLGGNSSVPFDINDNGVVVGTSTLGDNASYRGYIYENGSIKDLSTLIDSDWIISSAQAINNSGQIAADGCRISTSRCGVVMLSPVPENSTYAMLTLGLAMLGLCLRRTR